MSKFRNLFKKFSKKNKKPQDSDEDLFEEIEEEANEEIEDSLDEPSNDDNQLMPQAPLDNQNNQTVIIKTGDSESDELIAHPSEIEGQIPAQSDLSFPNIPTAQKEEADTDEASQDATGELGEYTDIALDISDLDLTEEEEQQAERNLTASDIFEEYTDIALDISNLDGSASDEDEAPEIPAHEAPEIPAHEAPEIPAHDTPEIPTNENNDISDDVPDFSLTEEESIFDTEEEESNFDTEEEESNFDTETPNLSIDEELDSSTEMLDLSLDNDEDPSFSPETASVEIEVTPSRLETEEEDHPLPAEDEMLDEADSLDDTATTETDDIDLTQTNLSFKEKLELMKTRIADQFRNINKKDLKKALASKQSLTDGSKLEVFKNRLSNIHWASIPTEFFNQAHRYRLHKSFQVTIIFIFVFIAAKMLTNIVNGNKNYKSLSKQAHINFDDSDAFSKNDLAKIKAANLLKTEQVEKVKGPAKKIINTDRICRSASKKSKANVQLINTIVLQDSVKSIASVQVRSSTDLKSIREGETLLGKIKIDRIINQKLIVKNLATGECESIESKDATKRSRLKPIKVLTPKASKKFVKKQKKIKGIETDGNNFKIDKKFLQSKLSDINSLLTQAKGIPITNPDGTISFKITQIDPGGIFAYLGMQDQDIITQINGEPIKELSEVMNLFAKVGNLSSLNITVNRGGEETTQNYNIK
ncbi:MAG: PDZ domain-containing protein [Halobacteriovoraceae bacterium]|jgi:type II secretory pathway component PulC|nr:PDZ domain-containing protein [Halobacteriovoraceae bacterium]